MMLLKPPSLHSYPRKVLSNALSSLLVPSPISNLSTSFPPLLLLLNSTPRIFAVMEHLNSTRSVEEDPALLCVSSSKVSL